MGLQANPMINLLSEVAKKNLTRERFSRLLIITGAGLLAILVSGALLITLTLASLNLQKNEFSRELEAAKKSPTLERVEEVEANIAKTNEKSRIFAQSLSRENRISPVLIEAISTLAPSVKISELTYNGPTEFRLKGLVGARDDLLKFIEFLDRSEQINEVNSPISNLLKDRNIEFSISFTAASGIINENPETAP